MHARDGAGAVGKVGSAGGKHDDVRDSAVGDRAGDRRRDRVGVGVEVVDREIERQEYEETVAPGDRVAHGGPITEIDDTGLRALPDPFLDSFAVSNENPHLRSVRKQVTRRC